MKKRLSHVRHLQSEWKNEMSKRRYYIHPNSKFRIFIIAVHLSAIVYSVIALLLKVSMALSNSALFRAMEVVILIESLTYIMLYFMTAQYAYGVLTMDRRIQLKQFLSRGLLPELFALIPFNLMLSTPNIFRFSPNSMNRWRQPL